jgi:glycerol kinase
LDRDGRGDVIRQKAGLPPATYFSGGKVQWILDNVDGVREAAEKGDAIFGTADTWDDEQRATGYAGWQKAVQRTLDWVDVQ